LAPARASAEALAASGGTEHQTADAAPRRAGFLLAARIAATRALHVPTRQARLKPRRRTSMKPMPKAAAPRPKATAARRVIWLAARPTAAPSRGADIIRLMPRKGARLQRLPKAA
jgi:hypothetical protein